MKQKIMATRRRLNALLLGVGVALSAPAFAFTGPASSSPEPAPVFTEKASRLLGIYEAISPGAKLPADKSSSLATLESLPLTVAARKQASIKPDADPRDLCQVLGPFRMMAQPDTKFEILRDAPNKFVLLFQQSSWGHVRTIGVNAEHSKDLSGVRPMWNGDSIASWEGDTLVVDSVHFTDKTWLNEAGVRNSKQLRLTERFHLLDDGRYLEYQATAVDPEVLTSPVSYTRYFKRTSEEITEYNCFDHKPAAGK